MAVHLLQVCLDGQSTEESCCGSSVCPCRTPDGATTMVGSTFKVNTTEHCTICTCVSSETESFLECRAPICPSVVGCPPDKLRLPDRSACCPVCDDTIEFECTGIIMLTYVCCSPTSAAHIRMLLT